MSKEKIEACRTPARKDKHLGMTLLFAAILTANHKAGLALTPGELLILGSALGAYMGQSQVASIARLREVLRAGPQAEDPKDGPNVG